MTPAELRAVFDGVRRRREDDHRARAWAVWHGEALARMKRLPDFERFARGGQVRPMTRAELQSQFDALAKLAE